MAATVLIAAACADVPDDSVAGNTTASATTDAPPATVRSESTSESTATSSTRSSSGARSSMVGYEEGPCPTPNFPGVPQLDLGPAFTCGTLTVPEDRSRPDSKMITIPVAIAKAQSPDPPPDPILYLTGGPGGTGLVTANEQIADGWNRARDVIFIDQRGTYHADPRLSCPEIDEFMVFALSFAPSSPEAATDSAAATRACRDRLAGDGWDLAAFDTPENAADIADLRVALGIDEWNVYGVSYGSDLALQLLRDHPEGIRSVIVDSLVPPQTNIIEGFWPSAAEGYRALFDACAAQPACQAAYPGLEQQFHDLVRELGASPRSVTVANPAGGPDVQVVIDGYALANAVVVASLDYNPSPGGAIASVPAMIHDLATGGGTRLASAMLSGVTSTPPGTVGYGLAYGVFCGEQIHDTSPERVLAEAKNALPDFPDTVLSLPPQSPHIFGGCEAWDVPKVDGVHEPAESEVPVLLLAGELDAVTAPSRADLAASTLPNSTVVRFPGAGHDVMAWIKGCAVDVMYAFLDAVGIQFDRSCVDALQTPPFATS